MVKPDRPQLGGSGHTAWAQFLHDGVVEPLLDDNGDLLPGVALPEGGVVGQVVSLGNAGPVWSDPEGPQGAGLEFDWNGTQLGVRVEGDETYTYVDLEGAQGPQGTQVELQSSATHIQWRYVGDPSWTDLIALADLEGPQGIQGETGDQGLVWRGTWDIATAYVAQDGVAHAGSSWIATGPSTGSEPSTASPDWDRLAAAAQFEDAGLDDLNDVDVSGAGSGDALVFDGTGWGPGAGGVTDHGALTGLTDDDHTLYALADGTRGNFATPGHDHDTDYDPAGTAAAAVTAHEAAGDPHPQYLTESDGNAAYAPIDADLASLTSGAATDGQLPTADGAGGVAWEDPPGGGAQVATGTYTGNGAGTRTIALPFDPVMVFLESSGQDVFDSDRGGGTYGRGPDGATAFTPTAAPKLVAGGFQVGGANGSTNESGATFHYVAIG